MTIGHLQAPPFYRHPKILNVNIHIALPGK